MLQLPTTTRSVDEQSSVDMDITDYRRETTHIQKRRSVALSSREDVPTPQKGQVDPLEHPRLGLVGWITYWSLGNCALAVKIIVGLIRNLNLTESVSETLTPIETKRKTETNTKIVNRDSSISVIDSARIIGTHSSTIKTLLSSSSAGSTEWTRMSQDSRSKSGRRTLTHHGHLWLC